MGAGRSVLRNSVRLSIIPIRFSNLRPDTPAHSNGPVVAREHLLRSRHFPPSLPTLLDGCIRGLSCIRISGTRMGTPRVVIREFPLTSWLRLRAPIRNLRLSLPHARGSFCGNETLPSDSDYSDHNWK